MKRTNSSGNAIWFILLAIVLIGALTMTLSRGGSSVDQSGDFERARVIVTQMMRYAKGLEVAVQNMQMRGISESDISFENAVTTTDYSHANCDSATRKECLVFHVEGGGMTYQAPPSRAASATEWIFTGDINVGSTAGPVGTTAAATGNDLLIVLEGVRKAVCIQLNREVDVDNPGGDPPVDTTGVSYGAYGGSFSGNKVLEGDPGTDLNRKRTGCYYDDGTDKYYFYHVLLVR